MSESYTAVYPGTRLVLLPGTAVLELALAAAQAVGGCTVAELMQSAPLVLTLQGAMRLQLFAGELDDTGARAFALYSRDDAAPDDAPWTCHATGLLGSSRSCLVSLRNQPTCA